MAIFKRKSTDPIAAIEAEVAELRTRRAALQGRLASANDKLERALSDQRRHLLEADLDAPDADRPRDVVGRLRDERDGLTDATAELDSRIVDAERKLVETRDKIGREAAARDLGKLAEALAATVEKFRAAGIDMVEAIGPLASLVPHASSELATGLASLTRDMAISGSELAAMARAHAAALVAGEGAVRHAPASPPPAPPPIPRRPVFLLVDGRWPDIDGERTAGRHRIVDLPVPIADSVLRLGLAIKETSGERARKLVEFSPPDYGRQPRDGCFDLVSGAKPAPPWERNLAQSLHEHASEARVGTAVVR
jgi:hypothetical protein